MEKLIKRIGVLVFSIIAITLGLSQDVKAGVNVEVDGTTAVVSWDGEGKAEIVGETSFTSFEVHTILDEVSDEVENVIIDKSIKNIGENAFDSCSNLKSITIPNSVKSIGIAAFDQCTGLESIEIPNSVKSIGHHAFCDCINLTDITISNSIKSIESWTFGGCESLTSIKIPNSVKSIGGSAFNCCSNLKSITIPNSVKFIEKDAFGFCDEITIKCKKGSYAHKYAKKNKRKCKIIK